METRSAEILSAVLSIAVAISMFTSSESTHVISLMQQSEVLPEWAIINIFCSIFCLVACLRDDDSLEAASRFLSGCVWGTIILIFAAFRQWLPIFWIAVALFSFDVYLVTIKGQRLWTRSNS